MVGCRVVMRGTIGNSEVLPIVFDGICAVNTTGLHVRIFCAKPYDSVTDCKRGTQLPSREARVPLSGANHVPKPTALARRLNAAQYRKWARGCRCLPEGSGKI